MCKSKKNISLVLINKKDQLFEIRNAQIYFFIAYKYIAFFFFRI